MKPYTNTKTSRSSRNAGSSTRHSRGPRFSMLLQTGIEVATVVTSCCIAAMFVGLSVQIRDMWKKGFPHCLNPRDNEVAHDEPVLQERGGGDDGPLPVSPSHSSTSKRKDETQTETSSPAQLEAAGDAASATPQDLRVQIPAFMGEAAANLEKGMDNPRLAAQTNIRDVIEILAELSLADMLPGDVTSLSPALGRKRSDEVFPNYFAFLREEGTERIFLWAAAIQASADEKQAAEIEAFTNPEEAFTPKDKRDLFSAVADGIAAEVVRTGATSASDVRQAEGPRSSIASFLAVDPVGRKFVAEVLGDWLGPGANCRDKDSGACPVQHLPPPRPQAVALFRLTQEVLKKLQEEDRDAVFQNLVDARMPDGAIGAVYGRAMIYQKSHCVKGNDGREPDGGRERSPLMRAAFAQFKREAQEEAADAGGRAPELETLLNAQVQEFLRQVGVGGGVVLQEQDKKEQAGAMASASGSRDPQGALEAGADAAQHGSGPALAAEEQKPNSSQPSHRATAAAGGSGQPSVVTTGAAANSSTAVRAAANPLGPGPEPAALRPGPGAVASGVRSAAATSGAAGGGPAGRVGPDAPQHLQSRPVIAAQHATQPTASTGKQPPEQAKNSKCC
ncbi:unnamed protein product [Amoebophrya sp. A120]|nr:unnamed protein product [Amoebophrya sp. A120]|eukprot:GSA120T00006976001.1